MKVKSIVWKQYEQPAGDGEGTAASNTRNKKTLVQNTTLTLQWSGKQLLASYTKGQVEALRPSQAGWMRVNNKRHTALYNTTAKQQETVHSQVDNLACYPFQFTEKNINTQYIYKNSLQILSGHNCIELDLYNLSSYKRLAVQQHVQGTL